ncbi:MAG: ABC transporter permease [Actinomycetales bacterium]
MTGTWALVRFALRRERIGLPIWVVAAAAFVAIQSVQSQDFYDDPEQLASLRATAEGNAALLAMTGPVRLLETVAGEVVFEIFSFVATVVALMSMFLVVRHTRADEEAGRAELVRSARVGRRAPLAAALVVAILANAAAGALTMVAAVATGLPVGGSVLLGGALASVGLAFSGLTAAAVQVFDHGRSVYGVVVAALGGSWALRGAGDVGDGALSWLSPIGWAQRTYPFVDDRWWPLLLPLGLAAATTAVAVALLDRRDLGAGLVASRPGRARASWALSTPLGLAWRLQRGSLAGWAAGLFLLGLAYGSFGRSIEEFVTDNPQIADFLPGGAQDVVDSFFAVTIAFGAVLAAAYATAAVLRARGEETSGRIEAVAATPTGRWSLLGSHLVVALVGSLAVMSLNGLGQGLAHAVSVEDPSQVPRLVGLSLAYLPAIWVVTGVTALVVGLLPRAAPAIAWAVVAYLGVVTFFGDSFELPDWARALSPTDHVPRVPLDDVSVAPLAVLTAVAVAATVAGLAAYRRRDLGLS